MLSKSVMRWFTVGIILFLLVGSTAPGLQFNRTILAGAAEATYNYLPIMLKSFPWRSPFGVEITSLITSEIPDPQLGYPPANQMGAPEYAHILASAAAQRGGSCSMGSSDPL